MELPVVIASYQRPLLLKQTIESLISHSDSTIEIIVIDDASTDEGVDEYIQTIINQVSYYKKYPVRVPIHTIKNKGELLAMPSEYIYFSDNDMYFEPHWDTKMIQVMETHPEIGILGGLHHPHHQVNSREPIGLSLMNDGSFEMAELLYSNEQPGYSMMIRRDEWKEVGPWFSEQLAGGEDSNLCRMAEHEGFKIAALSPSVVLHCGASGSHGNPAADKSQIMQMKSERPEIYIE